LGQAHKSDGVKPVNESPTLPFLTIWSPTVISYININK
jgi:hypothetical protein